MIFGIVFTWVELGGIYRTEPAKPLSRERLLECGLGFCPGHTLSLSPVRNRIYAQSFDPSIGPFGSDTIISIDPDIGSFERVLVADVGVSIFAIVPMRGDVDGDGDSDHSDLEWLVGCIEGSSVEVSPACDLADMDADGDVDLLDVRYFLVAHSSIQK